MGGELGISRQPLAVRYQPSAISHQPSGRAVGVGVRGELMRDFREN
jgi:hypothetical protein